MITPFFSIIIPIYKVQKNYLIQCIESVLNQSLKQIEVIIVQDGCEDALREICSRYASVDNRIKIIYQNNSGVSVARNRGISSANAEWIMFLDADDWLEKNACSDIYEVISDIDNNQIDIIQFFSAKSYQDREVIFDYKFGEQTIFRGDDVNDRIYLLKRIIQPSNFYRKTRSGDTIYHIWDKVFKKSFLTANNISFPIGVRLSEDKIFVYDCIKSFKGLYIYNNVLHHYRESSSSVKHSFSVSLDKDRIELFKLLKDRIENDKLVKGELENDLNCFIVAGTGEVVIRKYYHPQYSVSFTERRKSAITFCKVPIISSALHSVHVKKLSIKSAIVVILLRCKLFKALSIIFRIIDKIRERQN